MFFVLNLGISKYLNKNICFFQQVYRNNFIKLCIQLGPKCRTHYMVLFHISKKPKCRLKQKSTVIGLLLFICLTKESSKTFRFKGHRPFLDLSQLGCQFDFPPVVPICQLSLCNFPTPLTGVNHLPTPISGVVRLQLHHYSPLGPHAPPRAQLQLHHYSFLCPHAPPCAQPATTPPQAPCPYA